MKNRETDSTKLTERVESRDPDKKTRKEQRNK